MFVKAEAPEHRAHACDSGGSHPDLAAGDPEELFTQLFDTYAPALRSYFAGRVGVHLADDVVAETFLLALRKRATYDPSRGPVRAWLYGIATNVLRGYTRKELRGLRATARMSGHLAEEVRVSITDAIETQVVERVDAQRRAGRLAAKIARLSRTDRDILLLSAWTQLTSTEIGLALGMPASTVRSRLHRVRGALRAVLDLDEAGERQ
ncbi:RNA polymerase sigma factor [Saccharomonospora azurea]|uniref:RNA polymerase sigma factor, sigma-70 family n=1 Tax=Saccharomonospora azurea NA-128 TaxID=882081 RepID=H8G7E1_9PSEU|nr:RNA polymerase sigma factor [Saccharomonospora azurea]EHK85871.1 ECF subfamily RNA polymerase sigma factor [Saccharomonospora azurea SZMC 14600]EHY89336.1 RNA polymerase sigma factor, sigma-70 family [Saccharomonospora azurea NA-128]